MAEFFRNYLVGKKVPRVSDTFNTFRTFEVDNNHKVIEFSLVSLFNGISTLFRLFNAKAILLEEQ